MREGWIATTLGEVAEVVSGGTPSTSTPEFWDGDVTWITPTEVTANEGKVIFNSVRRLTTKGLDSSSAKLLPVGSVLLTSRATIGAVALAGTELSTNQGFASLIAGNDAIPRFLMYWCQQNKAEFESRAAGNTFKEISRKKVAEIPLHLPPLAEQRRIVDVIESVDNYITALETRAETARTARSALLHDLLSNPGSDWVETTLGDLLSLEYGKPLKEEDRDGHGFPVFGSAGQVGFHSIPLLRQGPNIVVGRKGTAGAVIWSEQPCSVIDTAYFVRQKIDNDLRFTYLLLASADLPALAAQTGVPGLNRERAYSVRLTKPPLIEQERIVAIVDSIDLAVSSIETSICNVRKLRAALLSDLLSGNHEIPASYDQHLGAA